MGQQQLLLIVLGVIIVGIAVVVGINVFTASSSQANRDATISDLTNLASLDTTGNGTYSVTVAAQTVTIVGTGNEKGNNGTSAVQVTMVVGPDRITSTTINN